jgi:dienelactone hydrolase
VEYRQYSRCLPDYLKSLADEAYQRRNGILAGLTSAPAIRARQQYVRDTFWKLVGGLPERTPLATRTTGAFERKGYRVEKIVYQSVPGLHIPANLYIPTTGRPPYPGVLFQMGHSLNGKAAEPYQKCCQGLARLGYVVLAFDPMGQGERTYYPKEGGTLTRLESADSEHTRPGRQMLLVGDTATRMQAWDAVRSLDVLAAHPLVDPKRLASTGQSGGGTLTMFLAAMDHRLATAAVSCGNTENIPNADFNSPGATDDAEQNFLNSAPANFDRWDLLYPLAPKPLLILVSARDFFGTYSPRYISNGREEFAKLESVYKAMNAAERIEWDETPTPHMLSYYMRTRIYAWFERWLKNRSVTEIVEPEVAPERDETLWVGPSGLVTKDFGSKTPFLLARERAATLKPAPPSTAAIRELLAIDIPERPRMTQLGRVPSEGADIAAIEVPTAPHVFAPAWVISPKKADTSKPVLLIVEPSGRSVRWREGDLYHQIAARGVTVCAADVRGIGDLRPEAPRGNPQHSIPHANEEHNAWAGLILGKPFVGQRAADLIGFVRAFEGRRVVLAAAGTMTLPALFAAALEPLIERLYLSGGLASYRSLLDFEDYRQPTNNFLFEVLRVADLPQVAALAAPRPVIIAGAVDGGGGRMDTASVRELYRGAANVEIRPDAAWTVDALIP